MQKKNINSSLTAYRAVVAANSLYLRKLKHLRASAVCRASGLSSATFHDLERGNISISFKTALRLASFYDVSVTDFLFVSLELADSVVNDPKRGENDRKKVKNW